MKATNQSSVHNGTGNGRKPLHRMSSSIMRDSVGSQFSNQLREHRDRIEQTTPHYACCLMPNNELAPNNFHPLIIADQVRCAGVLGYHSGVPCFPQRYAHEALVQRGIAGRRHPSAGRYSRGRDVDCQTIGSTKNTVRFSCGWHTKLVLRQQAFDSLVVLRRRKFNKAVRSIQSVACMYLAKTYYQISTMAVLILQSFARQASAMHQVRALERTGYVTTIQCARRAYAWARRYFSAVWFITIWCQSACRGAIAREIFGFW